MRFLAIVVGCSILATTAAKDPAALGTVDLKGGTAKVPFLAASVGVDQNPDISGDIKNSLGRPVTDVTIAIVATKPANSVPPALQGVTVNGHTGQGSTNTTSITVKFPNSPIGKGSKVSADIDLSNNTSGGTAATEYDIRITASVSKSSNHFDGYASFMMDSTGGAVTRQIDNAGNPRQWAIIENTDGAKSVSKLNGTVVFGSSQSFTIQSVELTDEEDRAVSTNVHITDNAFEITSFTPLAAGMTYLIWVSLDKTPSDWVKMELSGTWSTP